MPTPSPPTPSSPVSHHNEIHLLGIVRRGPDERVLPSGDVVVGLTVRVEREPTTVNGPRGTGDSIEIGVWAPGLRRRALAFLPGDLVEVRGSLRRQVRRAPHGVSSRYEVQAHALKRVARACA